MAGASSVFAYVLACVDPKIRHELTRHFDNWFGGRNKYFWVPELGGVKDLVSPKNDSYRDHIVEKIQGARSVHPFGLIILINHSNCGAYRLAGVSFDEPQKEEAFHSEELNQAKGVVKKKFPNLAVEVHYFLKDEQRLAW